MQRVIPALWGSESVSRGSSLSTNTSLKQEPVTSSGELPYIVVISRTVVLCGTIQMKMTTLLLFSLAASNALLAGAEDQTIALDQPLQIPGKTLNPGTYRFSVEDRLTDRAIVKITNLQSQDYQFILTVPTKGIKSHHGTLVLFPSSAANKQILQAWTCGDCGVPLQAIYSKAEAVAITEDTAKPVMAVDPSYDKLPENLSAADRKVVTLWLLSPKEVTSDQKGKGVEAAKYVAPSSNRVDVASNTGDLSPRHMPHTASNIFSYAWVGLLLLLSGAGLRFHRWLVGARI